VRISVIIPTFQGAQHLRQTLESVASQSTPPTEIVVSDDASADETVSIARAFVPSSATTVKVLSNVPHGISANYLNALAHASGDIVVVADQDDVWLPDRLATILKAFRQHRDVALVALDSEIVDESLKPLGRTLRGGRQRSLRHAALAEQDDFLFFLTTARLDAHTLSFLGAVRDLVFRPDGLETPNLWFENRVASVAMRLGRLMYLPQALTLYRQHASQHIGYSRTSTSLPPTREIGTHLGRLDFLRGLLQSECGMSLLSEEELMRRRATLDEFIAFQRLRNAQENRLDQWIRLVAAFFDGRYRRFANHAVLSLLNDLYRASWRLYRQ